ncbi:hypothetical protein EJB05_44508, partial [Eragrostis curvula]
MVGSPGTRSSLALRLSQSLCARASLVTLVTARHNQRSNSTGRASLSIMGVNSFAAVFAATGVTIYYERDAHGDVTVTS